MVSRRAGFLWWFFTGFGAIGLLLAAVATGIGIYLNLSGDPDAPTAADVTSTVLIYFLGGLLMITAAVLWRKTFGESRHPAEVTSDQLGYAVARWGHLFTAAERDAIAEVRNALEDIAEGRQADHV